MNEERDARAPVIETRRLVLRPIARSDTEALRRISNEPLVRRYLWDDEPVSREKIREVIDESARMFSAEGLGLFGVRLRGTQEIVGFCGFMRDADGPGEVELAY
jgi:[ribosomal protein S5]-alanine N-acetyltransferase